MKMISFPPLSMTIHMRFASALAFLVPLTAQALGIEVIVEGKSIVFKDVPQTAWYATYVRESAEAGIVTGYKDKEGRLTGMFGPSNRITVAEALKITVEGAGYDEEQYETVFASGVASHWSSPYVSVAKAEAFPVIQTPMRLDRPATRAEVAALFVAAFRVDTENVSAVDSRYTDVDNRTAFALAIEALSRDNIIAGDTDSEGQAAGTFRPTDPINRGEVAKMVVLARAEYGMPGEGRRPQEGDAEATEKIVVYADAGFSPQVLRVKRGETVTFKNETTLMLWVASDPHPSHSILPSLNSLGVIMQGEIYTYTFTQIGTFGFHNHRNSIHQGTIIVE